MKPPTRAPFYAAMYHGLCGTARKHGYALAIHGTVTQDLDLVAIPWVEDVSSPEVLKDALMKHIGAVDFRTSHINFGLSEQQADEICARPENVGADMSVKPHGRTSYNLYMDHGAKVDLSIMPSTSGHLSEPKPATPIPPPSEWPPKDLYVRFSETERQIKGMWEFQPFEDDKMKEDKHLRKYSLNPDSNAGTNL